MDNNELDRLRAGDSVLWHTINTTYRKEFISSVLKHSAFSLEDAEDAFQDAMVKFLNDLNSVKFTEIKKSLHNYILCISRNQLIDNCRKKSNRREVCDLAGIADDYDHHVELFAKDQINSLWEKVNKVLPYLSKDELHLFYLCLDGSYTMKMIARELNLPGENAASKRKHDLFEKIKKLIRRDDNRKH